MSLGTSIQPDCSHPDQLGPVPPATRPALPAAAAPPPPPTAAAPAAAADEALMIQRLVLEELVKSSCGL